MAKELINLKTTINTQFYNFDYSQKILREKSDIDESKYADLNNICKLLEQENLNFLSLEDNTHFELIKIDNYDKLKGDFTSDNEKLIFRIDKKNDQTDRKNYQYTISTGLFCGKLYFEKGMPSIEITAGISNIFFKRMLNYCCGIYADTNIKSSAAENESIYGLFAQYLFLISLRKVAGKSFPKKYFSRKDRGYDVKGDVDIEEYINKDILMFDKKVTYKYQIMKDIQNIIDVLYEAVKKCEITKSSELPEINNLKIYLRNNYSYKKCSRGLINNILKEKVLQNSLYSDFKRPLQYAKILLNSQELNSGDDSKIKGISGFLIDASFLWEMYLYNLLMLNLPDWNIDSQTVISFYEGTFYQKNNRPDLVLTNKNDGRIFVFDAKLKSMRFDKKFNDVDNADIRQLHAYSYYYTLKYKDKFCGAALIYPTEAPYEKQINNVDKMYSIDDISTKFGVFAVKDPGDNGVIQESEEEFIKRIKNFIQ